MKTPEIRHLFFSFLITIQTCFSSEVDALNSSYKILIAECKVSEDSGKSFLNVDGQNLMATKKLSFERVIYISSDSKELSRLARAGEGGKEQFRTFFKFHISTGEEIYPNLRVFGSDDEPVEKVHLLVLTLSPVPFAAPFIVVGSPTKADVDMFIQRIQEK